MTPPHTFDNRQYKCNRAANSKAFNSPHLLQKQVPNILKCRNVRGNESEREEGLLRPEPACRSLCEHYHNSHCVHDIPVGLGFGKVWNFADGKTINFYMEPQYSVWRSGLGAPGWQLFTGINFQFPFHFQFGSRQTGH
jgi:hypothetical protein